MKMPHVRLRRPSPAIVIACIALGVALAPVSYAAVGPLLPDSVGTVELQDGAVTTKKVRNFTLRKWDFKQGEFPQVPTNMLLGDITLRSGSVTVPAVGAAGNGQFVTRAIQVKCKPGQRAIAGGTSWREDANEEELVTVLSGPVFEKGEPVGWRARGGSDEREDHLFTLEVLCV
jgi:hypothetical protein